MKKFLTGIGVAAVFALILVLVLVKLFETPDEAPAKNEDPFRFVLTEPAFSENDSPAVFAQNCIGWYAKYYALASPITFDQLTTQKTATTCFSPSLLERSAVFYEVSETDPILITSGYYESWLTTVRARVVSQLSQTSSVEVTLGEGSEQHWVVVELTRSNQGWRITNVSESARSNQPL